MVAAIALLEAGAAPAARAAAVPWVRSNQYEPSQVTTAASARSIWMLQWSSCQ